MHSLEVMLRTLNLRTFVFDTCVCMFCFMGFFGWFCGLTSKRVYMRRDLWTDFKKGLYQKSFED